MHKICIFINLQYINWIRNYNIAVESANRTGFTKQSIDKEKIYESREARSFTIAVIMQRKTMHLKKTKNGYVSHRNPLTHRRVRTLSIETRRSGK